LIEPVPSTAYGESFFIKQLADASYQQHFVMLIVTSIASTLDRFELREFLLPVAQHVRLYPAQLADLTDGEVAFGRDGGQARLAGAAARTLVHGNACRPSPSISGSRGRSPRAVP